MSEDADTTPAQLRQARRVALGASAEQAVVQWLVARRQQVLGTNIRVGRLEIDVLARDRDVIAVIEVRTRSARSWERGLDSIGWKKRQKIRWAGERLWRARFSKHPGIQRMRFDCASVTFEPDGTPTVEYVIAAF